jgi:hypothetical protein
MEGSLLRRLFSTETHSISYQLQNETIYVFEKKAQTYPVSVGFPSVHMTEETAEPVPIHTKRIMARNSAASCL